MRSVLERYMYARIKTGVSAHIGRHAEGMRMPKFKGTLRVHEVLCLSDQSHAVLGHLQECVSVSCRRAGEPYW